jgi:hypothetical protein
MLRNTLLVLSLALASCESRPSNSKFALVEHVPSGQRYTLVYDGYLHSPRESRILTGDTVSLATFTELQRILPIDRGMTLVPSEDAKLVLLKTY